MSIRDTTLSVDDPKGSTLVNHWQRGVPLFGEPVVTRPLLVLASLAALGLVLALVRFFSPLGPFSAMNDAYAWVVPAGYGETHPVANNTDAKGQAMNRRVEVKVLVPKGLQEGSQTTVSSLQ